MRLLFPRATIATTTTRSSGSLRVVGSIRSPTTTTTGRSWINSFPSSYHHHHHHHQYYAFSITTTTQESTSIPSLKQPCSSVTRSFSTDATTSDPPSTSSSETTNTTTPQPLLSLQLYQYTICPFCNRVKALLDYAGMKYDTIEVNPLTKAEIKPFGYSKVPILTVARNVKEASDEDPQPIVDSAKIVQGLLEMEQVQTQLQKHRGVTNLESFQNGPRTQSTIDLAMNDLAAVLYPNMCGSFTDSHRAFEYVRSVPSFGPIQRFLIQNIGAFAMYMAASRVKKKRNITDERKALDEILVQFESELASSLYLSGASHPDLGDITVYGVLRSIESLPIFDSILRQRGGPLVAWYDRMTKEIKS